MRIRWIGDVLRSTGLEVVEFDRPYGRGSSRWHLHGVVWHDTVTPASWRDINVAKLLRDGHSSLPGPLSQLGLDRSGRFWVIADGRSNHNGYGTWGNNSIGIETFCAGGTKGAEEPWNANQRKAAAIGTAAILKYLRSHGYPTFSPFENARGHKETDSRRKIDPYATAMDRMRSLTWQYMHRSTVTEPEQEENPVKLFRIDGSDRVWATIGGTREPIPSRKVFDVMGYNMSDVHNVSHGHPLALLPVNPDVALFRIAGRGNEVWASIGGTREHIPTAEAFHAFGHSIHTLPVVNTEHPWAKLPVVATKE